MWFRTDPDRENDQGNGQSGERSRRQDSSVHPLSPQPRFAYNPRPPEHLSPAAAFLRSGTEACPHFGSRMSSRDCARCSASGQHRHLAHIRSIRAIPPATIRSGIPHVAPRMSSGSAHFSAISNRNTPANRSYTKYDIKPCLTGTRIAHFARGIVQRGAHFSTISTRHSPKSRTYRKHMSKPSLPGARIAYFRPPELAVGRSFFNRGSGVIIPG